MVTKCSPRGHQVVTKLSPSSHQVVTKLSASGQLKVYMEITEWSNNVGNMKSNPSTWSNSLKPYFPSCNKYFPVQICGWDVTIISQFRFMDERYQLFPNLNLRIRCNNDFPIQMCGWDVKIFPNTNLWILSMESMRWTNYEWERLQIVCRLIQITFRAKSAWRVIGL